MVSVEIIIDGDTLHGIRSRSTVSEFLVFWIGEDGTKAVVPKREWNNFRKELEHEYHANEMEETFFTVMASFRGIITPEENRKYDDKMINHNSNSKPQRFCKPSVSF